MLKQNETLAAINDHLFEVMNKSGFSIEQRDCKPHLPLAREVILMGDLKSISAPDIVTKISSISLMKSERIAGKLTYTEIYTNELGRLQT